MVTEDKEKLTIMSVGSQFAGSDCLAILIKKFLKSTQQPKLELHESKLGPKQRTGGTKQSRPQPISRKQSVPLCQCAYRHYTEYRQERENFKPHLSKTSIFLENIFPIQQRYLTL
jgi:hypothetical protein